MTRSTAFIAVGGAVVVATVILTWGVASGGGTDSHAGAGRTSPAPGQSTLQATPGSVIADQLRQNLKRLEQQHAEHPHDAEILLKLGTAYYLGQRFRRATQAFERALSEDPGSTTAKTRLAMVWHANGESERAEQTLAEIIAGNPRHQEAHYSLAIIYFSDGRVEEAKVQWREAARIDSRSTVGRRSQSFVDLLRDSGPAAETLVD